jgi:aminoglycoside phosphotransferase (APT) family kinase protein
MGFGNHDDLNENNIIVDKEGTVVGILDWDQTIARVPGLDVRPYEEWFDEIPDERMQDELREWFSNELI